MDGQTDISANGRSDKQLNRQIARQKDRWTELNS